MSLAGFPASEWETGAAIAKGESGWNPLAKNTENANGSTDFGLWQINSVHANLLATHDWKNPVQNTQMALKVFKDAGNSWSPWVAYTSGSYKRHLSAARSAGAAYNLAKRTASDRQIIGGDADLSTIPGITGDNSIQQLLNSVQTLTARNTWIRVGMFAAGAFLVIVGLVYLLSPLLEKAKDLIPAGRIGEIAGELLGGKGRKRGKRGDGDSESEET